MSDPSLPRKEVGRNYLLALLTLIYASSQMDRAALGLVMQDVKLEFTLSDTQLGLITGLAFSLFYAVLGLPIARWADRGNRGTIISLTTALWSVAVIALAMVGNFWQLLLARAGAAIGEAGCVPPANSLLADYFPRSERARAMSRYALGIPLAIICGYFIAGWLNQFFGWRVMFMALSVPGLILAAVAGLTIKDPRATQRQRASETANGALVPGVESIAAVAKILWANRTFRRLLIFQTMVQFIGSGTSQWLPAFMVRTFALQTGELGTWLGIIYGAGGAIGAIVGGEIASRYAAEDEALQVKLLVWAYVAFGALSFGIYWSPDKYVLLGLKLVSVVVLYTTLGPMNSLLQSLVPDRIRATGIAFYYLVFSIVGVSLGPLAVGALSDALTGLLGASALRFALIAMCPLYVLAGWYFFGATRTIAEDIHRAQQDSRAQTDPRM